MARGLPRSLPAHRHKQRLGLLTLCHNPWDSDRASLPPPVHPGCALGTAIPSLRVPCSRTLSSSYPVGWGLWRSPPAPRCGQVVSPGDLVPARLYVSLIVTPVPPTSPAPPSLNFLLPGGPSPLSAQHTGTWRTGCLHATQGAGTIALGKEKSGSGWGQLPQRHARAADPARGVFSTKVLSPVWGLSPPSLILILSPSC